MSDKKLNSILWDTLIVLVPAFFVSLILLTFLGAKEIISQIFPDSPSSSVYVANGITVSIRNFLESTNDVPVIANILFVLFWVMIGLFAYICIFSVIQFIHSYRNANDFKTSYKLPTSVEGDSAFRQLFTDWALIALLLLANILMLVLIFGLVLPTTRQWYLSGFFNKDLSSYLFSFLAVVLLGLFFTLQVFLIKLEVAFIKLAREV